MKKLLSSLTGLLLFFSAVAGTVDTVNIQSKAMGKSFKCVVIKPDEYIKTKDQQAWPVVYLLHGYGGSYSNWITKVPALKQMADEYKLLVVCPDGGFSSWYFDSPVDPAMKYETYVAIEVPAYIDEHYHTIKSRNGKAITGLSMGGHGGLFIGFRHADGFCAAGSMSGGVDLSYVYSKFDIMKRLEKNWKAYSVINIIEHYPKDSLALIIDCGTEDPFFPGNRALHEKMLKLKIPHDYIERTGMHNWNYWTNAVAYQLLFFSKVLNNANVEVRK